MENELGRKKYLALIFCATAVGTLSYGYFFSNSGRVLVGASGGIMGVMTFYLLRFPSSRFAMLFLFYPFIVPGWAFMVLFFFKDIFGLVLQANHMTHVSHMSHIGGAAVGIFFYLLYYKNMDRSKDDFFNKIVSHIYID